MPTAASRNATLAEHRGDSLVMTAVAALAALAAWSWDLALEPDARSGMGWAVLVIVLAVAPYGMALRLRWSVGSTSAAAAVTVLVWECGCLFLLGGRAGPGGDGSAGVVYCLLLPLLTMRGLPLGFNFGLLAWATVLPLAFAPAGVSWHYLAAQVVPTAALCGVALYCLAVQERRLQAARRAAEAVSEARSEFLTGMRHELRTPLNAILGFAQLQRAQADGCVCGTTAHYAAQIEQAGWHLVELIDDDLDAAESDEGGAGAAADPVDLKPLLDMSVAMVEPMACQRGVTVTVELPPTLARVVGDRRRIRQIIVNLLSNAVKYNKRGGLVRVTANGLQGQDVEVSVEDSGLGLSRGQLAQLFQPYNRLGRESSGVQGTGVGLAISRRLAEQMGGSITASSREGIGSVFRMRLPAEAPAVNAAAQLPHAGAVVAMFEDDPISVEIMRAALSAWPHVKLVSRAYGAGGLIWARNESAAVILLDLHLQDMHGLQLLHKLKADGPLACVPVLVVSADSSPEQAKELVDAGAAAVLSKPWDLAQLHALLSNTLGPVIRPPRGSQSIPTP